MRSYYGSNHNFFFFERRRISNLALLLHIYTSYPPFFDRLGNQFIGIFAIVLFEHILPVLVNGFFADVQVFCNFLVQHAVHDEYQDLLFSFAEGFFDRNQYLIDLHVGIRGFSVEPDKRQAWFSFHFQVADIGIVEDILEFIPALTEKIKEIK